VLRLHIAVQLVLGVWHPRSRDRLEDGDAQTSPVGSIGLRDIHTLDNKTGFLVSVRPSGRSPNGT